MNHQRSPHPLGVGEVTRYAHQKRPSRPRRNGVNRNNSKRIEFYKKYRVNGGSRSLKDMINDFRIVACASFYGLDIVVSHNEKSMLSPEAIRLLALADHIPCEKFLPASESHAACPFQDPHLHGQEQLSSFHLDEHNEHGFRPDEFSQSLSSQESCTLSLNGFYSNSSLGLPVCRIICCMTNRETSEWCGTQVVRTLPPDIFLNVMCLRERTSENPLDFNISITLLCGSGRSLPMKNTFRHVDWDICERNRHDRFHIRLDSIGVVEILVNQVPHVFLDLLLGLSLSSDIKRRAGCDEPLAFFCNKDWKGYFYICHMYHDSNYDGQSILSYFGMRQNLILDALLDESDCDNMTKKIILRGSGHDIIVWSGRFAGSNEYSNIPSTRRGRPE